MAFVTVAKMKDIPLGRVRIVEIGDKEVALCNVNGAVFAIANVCTHDDGPLGEGRLLGDEIECPRHGARFCVRTGEVRSLPASVPVPALAVKVEGDKVLVSVE